MYKCNIDVISIANVYNEQFLASKFGVVDSICNGGGVGLGVMVNGKFGVVAWINILVIKIL